MLASVTVVGFVEEVGVSVVGFVEEVGELVSVSVLVLVLVIFLQLSPGKQFPLTLYIIWMN